MTLSNKSATLLLAVGMSTTLIAVGAIFLSGSVEVLGRNVPDADLNSGYLSAVGVAIALGAFFALLPNEEKDRLALLTVWSLKVAVTLGVMLFYEDHYYLLDSYVYYSVVQSGLLQGAAFSFGDGTGNTISIVWLMFQAVPDSFHALKVLFSGVGLAGVFIIYRASALLLGGSDLRVFYGFALFPSILFWSSIIGKDPVVLFGIGLYIFGVVGWYTTGANRYLIPLATGVLVAILIRLWLGPVLLAPLLVQSLMAEQRIERRLIYGFGAVVLLIFAATQVLEMFDVESQADLLAVVDTTAQGFSEVDGGSSQEINRDLSNIPSLVGFMPLAIFTTLFRPLPGEVNNVFGVFAGLESAALLAMSVVAAWRVKRQDLRDPIVQWAIFYVILWTLMYSFVSYGNLGTAVRYRLQVLPVLLGLVLFLGRRRERDF